MGSKDLLGGGLVARQALSTDLENNKAAFEWLLSNGAADEAIRMALVLHHAFVYWAPGFAVKIAQRALARAPVEGAGPASECELRLLLACVSARRDTDELQAAHEDLERAKRGLDLLSETMTRREWALLRTEAELQSALLSFRRGCVIDAERSARSAVARVGALSPSDRRVPHLEGRIRSAFATILSECLRDESGLAEHARAVAILETTGDVAEVAMARFWQATNGCSYEQPQALEELEAAAAEMNRLGLRLQETALMFALAQAYCASQDIAQATKWVRRAEAMAQRLGWRRLQLCCTFLAGPLLEERGALSDAGVYYEKAVRGFGRIGELRFEGLAHVFLGGVVARQGDPSRAETLLWRAKELLAQSGDARYQELISLQRGHVELVRARASFLAGRVGEASRLRKQAEARVAAPRRPRRESEHVRIPLTECCPEARKLVRILDRELERTARQEQSLWVAGDGSSFSVAGGSVRRLPDGPVIRRLLTVLAERRLSSPGTAVPTGELIQWCWEGERMQVRSGQYRVRTLVRRLRQLGLEGILLTGDHGGYCLDPSIPLELAAVDRAGEPLAGA